MSAIEHEVRTLAGPQQRRSRLLLEYSQCRFRIVVDTGTEEHPASQPRHRFDEAEGRRFGVEIHDEIDGRAFGYGAEVDVAALAVDESMDAVTDKDRENRQHPE